MANKKISDVEGIGPVISDKLIAAGVKDTNGMLAQCKTPASANHWLASRVSPASRF